MKLLYDGWLASIFISDNRSGIWLERKNEPARTPADALPELERMREAFLGLPTTKMTLVIDTRSARGRNDPEFEAKIFPAFRAFGERFGKVAVVVATSAGEMQLARLMIEHDLRYRIFRDEAQARAFAGME